MEIETPLLDKISNISTKRFRYPGDISDVDQLTPSEKTMCIKVLKRACKKKDKIINRLRVQHIRQKRKIVNLQELLTELRQKFELSENVQNIVQVKNTTSLYRKITAK